MIQLLVDILSAKFVDRIGYRKCIIGAHVFAAAGFIGMAVFPVIISDKFIGLFIAAVLYGIGGGLIEVLISPIVEACPTEKCSLKTFWLFMLLMVCAGAAEQAMSQWASAFAESGLGVSKIIGDLAGPCLFSVFMGSARTLYAKVGEKVDLLSFIIGSGFLCIIAYCLTVFSTVPAISLVGCGLCGLFCKQAR